MCIKIHGGIQINNWQILTGTTHDLIITLHLQDFNQIRTQSTVEHLRWSFPAKVVND